MANLALLYSNEIIAGLKVKAAHLRANVLQLVNRSNLQDSQIADLQSADTGILGRLSVAESDIDTAQADIDALQARIPEGCESPLTAGYTVDPANKPIVHLTAATYGYPEKTVTLPIPTDLPYGTTVIVSSDVAVRLVSFIINNDGPTPSVGSLSVQGGSTVTFTVVKDVQGGPSYFKVWSASVASGKTLLGMKTFADEAGEIEPYMLSQYALYYVTAVAASRQIVLPRIAYSGYGSIFMALSTSTTRHITVVEDSADGGSTVIDHSGTGVTTWYELRPDVTGAGWKYKAISW